MVDCVSAEVEDVDIATVVDPVVVLGMSDEESDLFSAEVSGVDVSPTVVDCVSAEEDDADIAIVVDLFVLLGCPKKKKMFVPF